MIEEDIKSRKRGQSLIHTAVHHQDEAPMYSLSCIPLIIGQAESLPPPRLIPIQQPEQ